MADAKTRKDPLRRVAILSTYLPRRCGIATFATSLSEALAVAAPETDVLAIAMNDRREGYQYPQRVKFEVPENRPTSYRLASEFLNINQADVVSVQHEYGIFGGPDGRHVLDLVRRLRMPVVTTLHTVLNEPTDGQHRTLVRLAELSDRLVVMAHRAVEFLTTVYGIDPNKVVFIPHGIPDVPFVDPNYYKEQFGLLGPGKGIESTIDALPRIRKAHPDAVYLVVGPTHPHVQAKHSEDYRMSLEQRAARLGVGDAVMFHNRFVKLHELCEFLSVADVYVTPYLNEAQVTSGTLAYAMGTGNAVVSTPYWYAQEMLADGRGRLTPFRNPDALADTIVDLFTHETERHAIRKRAYDFTRTMVWPRVAEQYLGLFAQVVDARRRHPRPVLPEACPLDGSIELPPIKLGHLRTLTDDTGILQHARGTVPRRGHGYCTDDNARALVVALVARDLLPGGAGCTDLANRYLSFLDHAFNDDAGRFRNFMDYNRQWLEEVGSEDSHGRALWALGKTVALSENAGHLTPAVNLFHRAFPAVEAFTSPRAWAFALIGLEDYLRRFSGETHVHRACDTLASRLMERFQRYATDEWPWPEDTLTYDSPRLPQALILAGRADDDRAMVDTGLRTLAWLLRIQTSDNGCFAPVGNQGWYPRGEEKARFDQQPIEVAAMVSACLAAFRATSDRAWLARAERAFDWFIGDNDMRTPICDRVTGGCRDGLQAQGINENQGAESTLAYLLALLAMHEQRLHEFVEAEILEGAPEPEST